jgi:hypothetical protein
MVVAIRLIQVDGVLYGFIFFYRQHISTKSNVIHVGLSISFKEKAMARRTNIKLTKASIIKEKLEHVNITYHETYKS